jgi:hypothetical protein
MARKDEAPPPPRKPVPTPAPVPVFADWAAI